MDILYIPAGIFPWGYAYLCKSYIKIKPLIPVIEIQNFADHK
jgi:hypothetical protein